jgi:mono/diheme cytochrome c family protein
VRRTPRHAARAVALLAVLSAGCRGQTSDESPVLPLRNMWAQQKYVPQDESNFFGDHRSQRQPIEGTVAREDRIDEETLTRGVDATGGYVPVIPDEIVRSAEGLENLTERGKDRYQIYCTPCHGGVGDGRGIVPVRALSSGYNFPAPPTFHQERVRHMPDGQLFATISNGARNMPAYSVQIPVQDRWAIVAYVRALQLSQSGAAQ